jgi:hypothetical protein
MGHEAGEATGLRKVAHEIARPDEPDDFQAVVGLDLDDLAHFAIWHLSAE